MDEAKQGNQEVGLVNGVIQNVHRLLELNVLSG